MVFIFLLHILKYLQGFFLSGVIQREYEKQHKEEISSLKYGN